MRQLPKKHLTKIDPREELSPYLNHQENKNKKKKHFNKVSASLSKLHLERKRSLVKNLGIIIGFSAIAVIALAYYVSPLANVNSLQVKGADDLSPKQILQVSGIKAKDKVLDYKFHETSLNRNLTKKYPEIKNVNVKVQHFNCLVLDVQENKTIAYIKEKDQYRKVLADGKVGSTTLAWAKINQSKPLFIGYNQKASLANDLKLFNSLPASFRDQVKLLSGATKRKSQIVFVMKDGNIVVGDTSTIKGKIKYYQAIKEKAGKYSLIDLEVGAFSRPLTTKEKRAYDIS